MFWISKKTVFFADLFNANFIDIHNHLLPGIDDGSKSVEYTNKMIEAMQNLGVKSAIATPHTFPGLWNNTNESIATAFASVTNPFIQNYSSEYFADSYLVDLANDNQLISLPDNHLLVEFSMLSAPVDGIMDVFFDLKLKDFSLILAHPERYSYWEKNISFFENLKAFDLSFQLNVLSLIGYYGEDCKKLAEFLLQNDFYDFIGTDFHSMHHIDFVSKTPFSKKYEEKIAILVDSNLKFEQ
jgi:protein-tyrosine phosphatase